ncbi:MAG: hypothetical protein LBJ63_08400 [Prevotellaceae bacterium]|jgi:hypothetical protein|nr:hypothetical protein [Prevotellaceae bacterium]
MNSRIKADYVLSNFDTVTAPKLLYSIDDKYYYLIIGFQYYYKEYYINTDSLGTIEISYVENDVKSRHDKQYRKMLIDANPFDLSKYHTDYITNIPDAECCTFGKRTYFVIKDRDGKRYGEFNLFMPVLPSPIDLNLWIYLVRRLSEQIK